MPRPSSIAATIVAEIVVAQDERRSFLRYIGSGDSHRDADIGRFDRRRIVDAVACHRHDMSFALQRFDNPQLMLRRNACIDIDIIDLGIQLLVATLRPAACPLIDEPSAGNNAELLAQSLLPSSDGRR